MIVNKERVSGTSRYRYTFDSGKVLESQLVFMKAEQWRSVRILANLKDERVSAVIASLVDEAIYQARKSI